MHWISEHWAAYIVWAQALSPEARLRLWGACVFLTMIYALMELVEFEWIPASKIKDDDKDDDDVAPA